MKNLTTTFQKKLDYIYKETTGTKIDTDLIKEAMNLQFEEGQNNVIYLRMAISDIRATIECEGWDIQWENALIEYTNKCYKLLKENK